MPVRKEQAVIDRSLSSLESVVAGLRRDVDRLEKRPLCKGGKQGGSPAPPPPIGAYGYIYLYEKATGKVYRATQDRIHPEVVMALPKGVTDINDVNMDWEYDVGVAHQGVWMARKGYDEIIVDFNAGTVSPGLPTPNSSFHHQLSYAGPYDGGKYAVIGEYRYGSEGIANLYDVATGERIAELRENQKFDVDPQDGTPIVTRALTGERTGIEVWDTTGGKLSKLRDVVLPIDGYEVVDETGCVYTGMVLYNDYKNVRVSRFFNWETGEELNFKNKNIPNSISYNGWICYSDGVRLHPDGAVTAPSVRWGSPPPPSLGPGYIAMSGIVDVMGNEVLNPQRIPGFSSDAYGIIFDRQPSPPYVPPYGHP